MQNTMAKWIDQCKKDRHCGT